MPIDLDIIFLALLLSIWAILGLIPWFVLAVRRRGRGVLIALPLAIAGGIGGGVLVPAVDSGTCWPFSLAWVPLSWAG